MAIASMLMTGDRAQVKDSAGNQELLVRSLLNPARCGPGVTSVEMMQTHTAYILLAGEHAYKIKKAVNLGFLDFSTLNARRFYCEEELRLNRRFAPQLYLAVIPITGTPVEPVLDGEGVPIEWAVRMRRFDQCNRLDHLLAEGRLTPPYIDTLADTIAGHHELAAAAGTDSCFGHAESIGKSALENFPPIKAALAGEDERATLAALELWTCSELLRLEKHFEERRRKGHVRECHGDLHLENIALIDGAITLFDCLEFNPELRWIDTLNEIAFLRMDLVQHGRADLAHRMLSRYLERNGDFAGLPGLQFYTIYRALVRAKVQCLRAGQPDIDEDKRAGLLQECTRYIALAQQLIEPAPASLFITHGCSGSGKTTGAQCLLEAIGAIRIRSDIERHRLPVDEHSDESTPANCATGRYTPEEMARTYRRLADLAAGILDAGYSVIVDATFLKRAQRDLFRRLAAGRRVNFYLLDFVESESTLRERITARLAAGGDASEADLAVLDYQLATEEPLEADEFTDAIHCNARLLAFRSNAPGRWTPLLNRASV